MTEYKNFEDMNLSEEVIRAVQDMGFEEATPIQSQAIEIIMSGQDVIGQSQTGTGKTAAFGIPCIEQIDPDDRYLQAVILCPTRELAIQVCEEFRKLLKYKDNIKVVPVYGGQPIDRQISALKKGAQIIIGTPGRFMDHMRRHTIKVSHVQMVVLDEADEMLDMGFREDIELILSQMPVEERQTILFSATMPQEILDLTKQYQRDPQLIKTTPKELTVPKIEQIYFEVKEKMKLEALCRLIDLYSPERSMVFCNTKKRVDELTQQLQGRGYFADGLHGDLKQVQRDLVMKKFRQGTIEILVATDVAARGIDVDDIDIVFNYDIPSDEEYYVHRIGRTGRAGKTGKAYTFAVGKEVYKLRDIMRYTGSKILPQRLPTLSDIEEVKTRAFLNEVKASIDEGHLTKYVNLVESLVEEDYSVMDIAAALLKRELYDETSEEEDDISITPTKIPERDYSDADMVRLYINIGKNQQIRTKDIVGAIAGETGIPGKIIGAIDIFDNFTFVDIPVDYVKDVLIGMKNNQIKGKAVNVERAQDVKGSGRKGKGTPSNRGEAGKGRPAAHGARSESRGKKKSWNGK